MDELQAVRSALDRKDIDRARSLLEPLIRSAPEVDSVEDLRRLAALAEEAGETGWAETAYNLVLRSVPADEGALSALAALAEENGEFEKVCSLREKISEISPDDTANLLVLRRMYTSLSWPAQTERIEKLLKAKGVRLEPDEFFSSETDSPAAAAAGDTPDLAAIINPSPAEIARFLSLFSGRENVHARQWFSPHKLIAGYSPVEEAMTARHVRQHLFGDITLGVYPLRLDGTCRFFALDLDLSKAAIEWARRGSEEAESIRKKLGEALEKTRQALEKLGLAPLLEDSGYKGFHLWVFLERPERAEVLFGLGKLFRSRIEEELPVGINLEFFPKQARRKGKGLGNLIKLPLGIHRRTGRRAWLLDPKGRVLPQPFEALGNLPRLSHEKLMGLVDSLGVIHQFPAPVVSPDHLGDAASGTTQAMLPEVQPPQPPRWSEADFAAHPVIAHIIERCPVIADLATRALENRHLEHDEIIVLQQTFGHLPGGVAAFNYLLEHCPGAGEHLRLKSPLRGNPISCPRIRKRIPGVTSSHDCACDFEDVDDHYPTPVLHLRTAPEDTGYAPEQPGDIETLLRRHLTLFRRIDELKNELGQIERAAVTALSSSGGRLRVDDGIAELRLSSGVTTLVWTLAEEPTGEKNRA